MALDEALLEELEANGGDPVLRFWESDRNFVVLGLACSLEDDVHVAHCREDGVPILRRASGGGTVVQGPGCLSFALALPYAFHPDLAGIHSTNQFVLGRVATALQRWNPQVAYRGISDLAVEGRKISGNAQRRKRNTLLFHGTVLHGMNAEVISRYLKQPKRQPDYRENRPHDAFLRKLQAAPQEIKAAIAEAWGATQPLADWPHHRMPAALAEVAKRSPPQPESPVK